MRTAPSSLFRSLSWIAGSNVVRGACQWAVLSALAKLGTAEMVGQHALGLAVIAPFMLFAAQLNALQITDAKLDFRFADYLSVRLVGAAIALGIVVTIAATGRFQPVTSLVLVIVAASRVIESISDVFLSAWQQRERMSLVAIVWVVNAVSSLLLLGLALFLTNSIVWATVGALASAVGSLVGIMVLARIHPCGNGGAELPRWDTAGLRRLVLVALPMGAIGVLLSLNATAPRYMVQHYLGEASLGLFAAAAYPMVVADTLIQSLAQSAAPRLAKYHVAGELTRLRRTLLRLTAVGALIGAAAVAVVLVAGAEIMTLLYRAEYAAETQVFTLIVVSVALRYPYVFLGVTVTAMRHLGVQIYLRVAMLAVLIVSSPFLIRGFGLAGAALGLVIASALEGLVWISIGYVYVWREGAGSRDSLLKAARAVT